MRISTVLICVLALTGVALADSFTSDFSAGVGPNFSVVQERDFWSVDTDTTGLRISKGSDDGATYDLSDPGSYAGVRSVFTIDGDFTIAIDYDWSFVETPAFSGGASAAILALVSVSDPSVGITLNNFANWTGRHGTNMNFTNAPGVVPPGSLAPDTPKQGQFVFVRTGSELSGYATDRYGNLALVTSLTQPFVLGPMSIVIYGAQNQNTNSSNFSQIDPRGPMDVSFNNLVVEADHIENVVPESGTLILVGGVLGLMLWVRRRGSLDKPDVGRAS